MLLKSFFPLKGRVELTCESRAWFSNTPERRLTTHIYAVYSCSNCQKTRSQLQNHIAPTGKIFFPNWEIIFSQLSTACWRINIQKLSCHCFPDIIAAFFWFYCEIMRLPVKQKSARQRLASTIKANSGRLLRPNSVVYYDQRQPPIMTKAWSSIITDTSRQRSPPQSSTAPKIDRC